MSWQKAADRNRVGEKHEIEAANRELWFRPVRYPVDVEARISALEKKTQVAQLPKGMLAKFKPLISSGKTELTQQEVAEILGPEEFEAFIEQTANDDGTARVEKVRLVLRHGIGENNFTDEQEEPVTVDDSFVDELLKYPDVAKEMFEVIEEYNRPLAQKSSEGSSSQSETASTESSTRRTRKSMGKAEKTGSDISPGSPG